MLAFAFAGSGNAGSIAISDASFESPVLATGAYAIGVGAPWTSISGGGFDTATHNPLASEIAGGVAPDGSNIAMISANNIAPGAGITQTLTATLLANTTYTLTFDVIHLITTNMDTYLGSLSANGVTLASDGSLNPALTDFALDTIVYNSGPAPAELGQALTITLQGTGCLSGPGCLAGTIGFDNVQLDAVTTTQGSGSAPEPGTFGIVLAALASVALARRRRRTAY